MEQGVRLVTEAAVSVALRGLSKHYAGTAAVNGLDLVVPAGSLLSFLGPSGCGKTTTLRMIAGLIDPSAGRIVVGGRDVTAVPASRRNIGVLFQNYALFPHLSVAANIGFGLRMRRRNKAEIRAAVAEALELVHLSGFGDRMPAQLSGGQQQRVALARALAISPSVLLLDEPMSALDRSLREAVRTQLRELQQRLGITTIMVTHDQEEALTISDAVAVMDHGRIAQVGTPADIYIRPATRFVAGFIGTTNTADAEVLATGPDGAEIAVFGARLVLPSDAVPGGRDRVSATVRPEHVRFRAAPGEPSGPGTVRGTLVSASYRGSDTLFTFAVPDGSTVLATRTNDGSAAPLEAAGTAFDLCFGRDLRVLGGT